MTIRNMTEVRHALYINLDTRNDRREHVESQLSALKHGMQNLAPERFNAIKHANGAIGCSMSHLRCIKLAKERDWDHVLICEDDVLFTNVPLFLTQLNKFLATVPDWDVVLLAGNNIPPFQAINDACIKVNNCQTTTAYIVKKHYYDALILNYHDGIHMLMRNPGNRLNYAIDRFWFELQRRDQWFLITPLSVVQREDYSDIEGRVTNYSHLMLDIDKEALMRRMMDRNQPNQPNQPNQLIQPRQTMQPNHLIPRTMKSQTTPPLSDDNQPTIQHIRMQLKK
jgi:GR25 family glycosyltransferase involved in LPS biosynthesis